MVPRRPVRRLPAGTARPGGPTHEPLRNADAHQDEGDHPGRRLGHQALPADPGGQQAAPADLRQADDLLPAQRPDAGGDPRDPRHLDPHRPAEVPRAARRRLEVGHRPVLRRAGRPQRPGAGVRDRPRVRRARPGRPDPRRQHLPRRRPQRAAPAGRRRPRGATIFGYHVKDPQRYGVAEFDAEGRVVGLQEKPEKPPSRPTPWSGSTSTTTPCSTSPAT